MRTETLFPYLSQVPNPDLDVKSSQERISSRRQQTQELHPYLSFPLKIWEQEHELARPFLVWGKETPFCISTLRACSSSHLNPLPFWLGYLGNPEKIDQSHISS